MLSQMTKQRELPRWFWPAVSVAFSLLLLFISLSWLQWKLLYGFQNSSMLWDGGSERCLDNAEPLMPVASALHSIFCSSSSGFVGFATSGWREILARSCLYGGIVVIWLAARAMSGWWAAGVAAAYVATNPLLFALDKQVSPASLGILAAAVSCWLAIQAFSRPERSMSTTLRSAWAASALFALGLHLATVWVVLAQALYGLSKIRRRVSGISASATAAIVAFGCIALAFTSEASIAGSIVHADVRALPVHLFAFSWPDEWMSQPHMATYLSVGFVALVIGGTLTARSTILPFLAAATFTQILVAMFLSDDALVKTTSLGYATIVMALAIGALTNYLIQRKPHMLAFVVPAFIVAAQYAAFGRLALIDDGSFDFDNPTLPPIPSFAVGDHAIFYHDTGHGERITVHSSMDAYVNKRDGVIVQTDIPVTVRAIIPYRVDRGIWYAYQVVGDEPGQKWFVSDNAMWIRPDDYQCVRQPYSKVRLYEISNPAFREDGHSVLMPPGTSFRINGIQVNPYEPELHVDIPYGQNVGKTGWIYAQILLRADGFLVGERAMHFPCS